MEEDGLEVQDPDAEKPLRTRKETFVTARRALNRKGAAVRKAVRLRKTQARRAARRGLHAQGEFVKVDRRLSPSVVDARTATAMSEHGLRKAQARRVVNDISLAGFVPLRHEALAGALQAGAAGAAGAACSEDHEGRRAVDDEPHHRRSRLSRFGFHGSFLAEDLYVTIQRLLKADADGEDLGPKFIQWSAAPAAVTQCTSVEDAISRVTHHRWFIYHCQALSRFVAMIVHPETTEGYLELRMFSDTNKLLLVPPAALINEAEAGRIYTVPLWKSALPALHARPLYEVITPPGADHPPARRSVGVAPKARLEPFDSLVVKPGDHVAVFMGTTVDDVHVFASGRELQHALTTTRDESDALDTDPRFACLAFVSRERLWHSAVHGLPWQDGLLKSRTLEPFWVRHENHCVQRYPIHLGQVWGTHMSTTLLHLTCIREWCRLGRTPCKIFGVTHACHEELLDDRALLRDALPRYAFLRVTGTGDDSFTRVTRAMSERPSACAIC